PRRIPAEQPAHVDACVATGRPAADPRLPRRRGRREGPRRRRRIPGRTAEEGPRAEPRVNLMNFITAKTKIVIGLIGILISVLFVALALGLIPDNREAVMQGRAQFCESVAISSSAFISRHDVPAVDALLRAVVRRNPELIAAACCRENEEVIARAGDYTVDTSGPLSQFSTD